MTKPTSQQPQRMEGPELLPCPFCGSAAEFLPGSGRLLQTIEEFLVQPDNVRCSDGTCGARYCPGGFTLSEWNQRADSPELVRLRQADDGFQESFNSLLSDARTLVWHLANLHTMVSLARKFLWPDINMMDPLSVRAFNDLEAAQKLTAEILLKFTDRSHSPTTAEPIWDKDKTGEGT